jgi:hypothetical protein
MSPEESAPLRAREEPAAVTCATHGVPLEPAKIDVTYQGHTFPIDVPCCPVCGLAFISEDLVKGRMLEVEQTLEEK